MTSGLISGTRLTFVSERRNENGVRIVLCRCECGTEREFYWHNIRRGFTKSCGCLRVECTIAREVIHGESARANSTESPEYRAWRLMKERCLNNIRYSHRGITVCERWRDSYPNFLQDMGRKPTPELTLERIENDRGYEPGNVKWATRTDQNRNTRKNRFLQHNGERMICADWARRLHITAQYFNKLLSRCGSLEKVIQKLTVMVLLVAVPTSAQTTTGVVNGTLTPEPKAVTAVLYGKKTPLSVYVLRTCNYTGALQTLLPEQVYIAADQLPVVSTIDAQAVINQKFADKPVNKAITFVQILTGGIGFLALAAAKGTSLWGISAAAVIKVLGAMLGGTQLFQQYIEPALLANQPTLVNLTSNTLDNVPVNLAVSGPGSCATRTVYASPLPKGAQAYTIHFQFTPGSVPGPQPAPVPTPMLVPRRTVVPVPGTGTTAPQIPSAPPTTTENLPQGSSSPEKLSVPETSSFYGCTLDICQETEAETLTRILKMQEDFKQTRDLIEVAKRTEK